GPKEQITLYRALDAGAGGGTPDHLALGQLGVAIKKSAQEEEEARKKKPALGKHGWGMRRFVITTADGESHNPTAVKRVNDQLTQDGIPVDLLLIASGEDEDLIASAKLAYPSVTPVSNVNDLAQIGLTKLTQRIKKAFEKKI
ncbi:MAG: hypothetical protein UY76_C0042G0001, partial [Candidatus Uhrbacteria bacterium GW2011_GWA2_52_8d]